MDKSTELARMEHMLNTYWAEIEKSFLQDGEGFNDFWSSIVATKRLLNIVRCPDNDPIRRIIQWAGLRMIMEAREREIIPEQMSI